MLKKKARAGKLYACIQCAGAGYITEIVEHQAIDFVCYACSGTGSIPLKGDSIVEDALRKTGRI